MDQERWEFKRKLQQAKCLLTEQRINKMWYIYTAEYFSAIKMNEIGTFVETCMDLETAIQSEARKRKTNIVY